MIDYTSLRVIWWVLLGVLLIGFAVADGFDMGMGILLRYLGRNDVERRIVINTVGPVWEGNQVWFVLGGGAIFAAWPFVYAIGFSGFYIAMFVVLCALILRPVGFKFRSKIDNPTWKNTWDVALFLGGFVPALIFGVAIGNVLQGVPFHLDPSLRSYYTGSFWELLNPFAILCGLVSVFMLAMHGGIYLAAKTEEPICSRAQNASRWCGLFVFLGFLAAGIWMKFGIAGYKITSAIVTDGASNPLHKVAIREMGAWFNNYRQYPWMMVAPIIGLVGSLVTMASVRKPHKAFVISSITLAGIISTVGLTMFPFILPSSTNPISSLTVWDSSSTETTLLIMLAVAVVFIPVILAYTAWVYRVLKGKVSEESINADSQSY